MSPHPESEKRESNVRIRKMPPKLHRRVLSYKAQHHHRDLYSAMLDLIEYALTVQEMEAELLRTIRLNRLQAATDEP